MDGGEIPPITINVLGELTVLREGAPVPLPPSKKTRALLAYLAVSARPQRRERLCEIFWDVPDDPRGALRWSLSKLRKILICSEQSPIESDRNTVALRSDCVATDLDAVAGLSDASLAERGLGELEAAANAFRGGFLEDLSLARCPDFEAWRTARADELELLHARLLETLIDRLADTPERALHYAHELRTLRPDDEELKSRIESIGVAARRAGSMDDGASGAARPGPVPAVDAGTISQSYSGPRIVNVGPDERPQQIRTCMTPDGVQVAYALSGEGPTLVRAAHWMSHLEYDWTSPVWRHWMEALSDGLQLVRYDERGNGLSQSEVDDLSFEAMVADLEAIVDAAGLERFTLLGAFQGCAISIAYAVRHPERVRALVLYGGYARGWRIRSDPAQLAQREALTTLIRQGWGQDQPLFRQIFTQLYIPGATREQMDWFDQLQRHTIAPENAIRFHESFGEIDVTALLPKVSVPTLVMHTRGDISVPLASGKELAEGIAGARFVELDSDNHTLLADEPAFAAFISQLRGFIDANTAPAPSPATDLTRKQITALSAEIISPLQTLESENLEQVMQALDPMMDAACETVERHGGSVVSTSDFSLTALWGAPVATEDHSYRACRCSLALEKDFAATSQGQAQLHVGIDTGEAIIRPQRGQASGIDVVSNVVRRASQHSGASTKAGIVITSQTRVLVGGSMRTEPIAGYRAGTGSASERLYELIAENRALSRWRLRTDQGLTRLIGRATEMSVLAESWQRAREGHGQLVGIVADPGVGKSRLAHEFLASDRFGNFTILECGALEFDANVTLQVIRSMLESLFGLDEGIEAERAVGIVAKELDELGADPALEAPAAFALQLPVKDQAWLARDASDRIASVSDAMRALLQLECRRRPVALLVEDLHWIDAESERVLNQVIDGMAAQRLLLVANYRPEYSHNWSQKGLFQQIRLGALTAPETEDFVETLLGPDPSVAHLRPLLAEKSDGTPLFLEELVRMLAETGSLVGEQGDFTAPEPITELQIPPSVKPIIAARIDRLADDQRRVLQIASVIGKDVPRPILKELSGLERHDLDTIIAHLSQTEFLFELQSYPETEYTFKHALTHDVAYESLMAEERKRIHAEALRLMERLYQDQLDQNAERLADHALKAEEWGAAAKYLVAATDRALDHAAYSKAARFLEHAAGALDKLERTPERIAQAIDIRTRMRPALEGTGQYSLSLAWLDEAEKLATELGDTDRLEQVILHKSYANSTHGRLDAAIEDADRLRKIATEAGDNRYAAEANLAAAQALIFRHVANQVLERLEPHEADFTGQWRMERFGLLGTRSVFFLGYMSISASLTGEFARAHALAEAMNQVVHESGRPIDRYAAAYHESMVHILAGPSREYEARLAALAEECRVRAPSPFYCVVMSRLGHVRLLCRGPEEACETLEEAKSYATHSDMPHISAYSDAIRACAEAEASGPEALTALEISLQVVRDMGDPWVEIQLLRAVADVCEPVDALKHLSTAEAIATANGFRPDLARIHAARAEIAELHDAKLATRAAKQAHALFTELGLEPETAR